MIVYHTRDALDTEFTLDSIPADLATVDLGLVHPMTGPVHINGAKRGDAIGGRDVLLRINMDTL